MSEATSAAPTWRLPTRLDAAWLRVRVWGHVVLRAWRDLRAERVERHRAGDALAGATVVAQRRSSLWRDGREDEFRLVAGKVENLRIARRAFDGVVVPAGAVFSFWKQLGRPTRGRGFVEGREIRAGCVVPVVAGGLCQLSNALAACALECGMTLVERHAHTARIERDAAAPDAIDATVSWNYVDLRLQAPFDWRLEVELTGDELVVRVRAVQARADAGRAIPLVAERRAMPPARGCLTCDELRCFRHPGAAREAPAGRAAVLVDAWTPEFERWLRMQAADADWFMPWQRRVRRDAGAWTPDGTGRHVVARWVAWRRSALLRRAGDGGGRQAAVLRASRWLALDAARRLEPRHAALVVDQALLVPLADAGALQGRHYDVLVHALPADELQRRLDAAAQRWPAAASLRDFRADARFVDIELRALRGARRLVTPHADVARHLRGLGLQQVECVEWSAPKTIDARAARRPPSTPPLVAFPASALARKGAHELAQALRQLGWRLLVLGTPSTDAALWRDIAIEHESWRDASWLARADVVALPAHVEHAPRALLQALAHGLPVVATAACGLGPLHGVREIAPGDVPGLVAALEAALADARQASGRAEESLTPK